MLAITEAVAEGGFAAVTARGLASRAGVSTKTLYQRYGSLEDCLLSAHSLMVSDLQAELAAVRSAALGPEDGARRAIDVLVSKLADDAGAARMLLTEPHAADPEAPGQARHARQLLGEQLAGCARLEPQGAELPPLLVEGLASGVLGIVRSHLLADSLAELRSSDLVDGLCGWMLSFRGTTAAQLRELDRILARREAEAELAAPIPSSKGGAVEGGLGALSSDRVLLHAAALRLAAAEGFRCLTVADVCVTAGVSRRSFHRRFDSVEECFADAVARRVDEAFARAEGAASTSDRPPDRIYRAVASLCADAGCDGTLHGVGLGQLMAAGDRGLRCRESLVEDLVRLLDRHLPAAPAPRTIASAATAGALWGMLEAVTDAGTGEGPGPTARACLTYIALAPVTGSTAATATIAGGKDLGTTTREETYP